MIKRSYFYSIEVHNNPNSHIRLTGVFSYRSWFPDHQKSFKLLMESVENDHKTPRNKLVFLNFERLR